MSRTDPQVNFRIPAELKAKLESAAEQNKRSTTAELVARLDASFIGEAPSEDLLPASRAKEISAIARQSIPGIVKKRILEGINQAVAMGHATANIDFHDLELEQLPGADIDDLISVFSEWLKNAGYEIEWDGSESLWIRFDDL
ncbi:Arc family DNA-binding protein [Pseudomonas sp. abacavir_1]